jgi:hypothetical protein
LLPRQGYFTFDDWSPVVALVLLLSDWSPVVVVLSIVRLDRPRRSTVGDTVELEPVIAEFTLELEPVTDGLLAPFADEAGLLLEDEAALVEDGVLAGVSGMQSWCTGLAECSFAVPVSLPASFPACGWPKSLHSGLVAAAVVAPVADLAEASAARAEFAAPNMAATASALM